jgi:hypothetical protein
MGSANGNRMCLAGLRHVMPAAIWLILLMPVSGNVVRFCRVLARDDMEMTSRLIRSFRHRRPQVSGSMPPSSADIT